MWGGYWEWKRREKSPLSAGNVKGAPVMRDCQFKPIPLFARRDPFAKLQRVCIVPGRSSNSAQRLSPTHHLLIEIFKCALTPYQQRKRCRMNSPLFICQSCQSNVHLSLLVGIMEYRGTVTVELGNVFLLEQPGEKRPEGHFSTLINQEYCYKDIMQRSTDSLNDNG